MKPNIQTVIYGPCLKVGHSDCTAIISWHLGPPRPNEVRMFEVEKAETDRQTTYRLTEKERTTC